MAFDFFDELFGRPGGDLPVTDRGFTGAVPALTPLDWSSSLSRAISQLGSGLPNPMSILTGAPPRPGPGGPPAPNTGGQVPTASAPVNFTVPAGGFSPYDAIFQAHGATNPELLAILAAGSYAESGWNPNAVGDNGHSVGIFQMHDAGAGSGMGESRRDPNAASARMVPAYIDAYNRVKASNPSLSGAELASLVAAMAERPSDWQNPNSAGRNNYRAAYNTVMSRRGQ